MNSYELQPENYEDIQVGVYYIQLTGAYKHITIRLRFATRAVLQLGAGS